MSDPELEAGGRSLGDMDAAAFRRHGYAVVDWIADHFEGADERSVVAQVRPGEIHAALPRPPDPPEPFPAVMTDLEQLVTDRVRQLLGMDAGWHGVMSDTASMSTLAALAAARERADLDVRQRGMAGRPDLPHLRIYTSVDAPSSVEKAAIILGLGRDGVRLVPVDGDRRMDVEELRTAIAEDVRLGSLPLAVVATVGTSSTAAIDPVAAIADLLDELDDELDVRPWLHVDGAGGAAAAICDELAHVLDGVDRADSLVTNPHRWLFTPTGGSVLFVRDVATLTRTFSLVPDYLATDDQDVTDDLGGSIQLGRGPGRRTRGYDR